MNLRFILALILILSFQSLYAQDAVPQRVISLSPNLTEMIYDMGAQNQLVGPFYGVN